MKSQKLISLVLCLIASMAVLSPIKAGSEDDARRNNEIALLRSARELEFGNTDEKIRAAQYMGSVKSRRFVRLLGSELRNGLDNPELRRTPTHNPYVKYQIAWALGNIGHPDALPDLFAALEITGKLLDESIKETEDLRKSEEGKNSWRVILDHNKPGPALLRDGALYPASPDVYWSVADEFKRETVDMSDEGHRVRLEGYNYLNLISAIMRAIGEITLKQSQNFMNSRHAGNTQSILDSSLNALKPFINHPIPLVRAAAISGICNVRSLQSAIVLEDQFKKEEDPLVKVRISYGILVIDKSKFEYYRTIIESLHSPLRSVRTEAAISLRELAMGEAVHELEEALTLEQYHEVRTILQEAIHNAQLNILLPIQ